VVINLKQQQFRYQNVNGYRTIVLSFICKFVPRTMWRFRKRAVITISAFATTVSSFLLKPVNFAACKAQIGYRGFQQLWSASK
jgi:hypothetical protein